MAKQTLTAHRHTLARATHLDYCICKQQNEDMTVDSLDIEDTSDWLGCPTELETITHYKLMLENEVQELNLQLRRAPEEIFGLVKMYDEVSAQRDDRRAPDHSDPKTAMMLHENSYSPPSTMQISGGLGYL